MSMAWLKIPFVIAAAFTVTAPLSVPMGKDVVVEGLPGQDAKKRAEAVEALRTEAGIFPADAGMNPAAWDRLRAAAPDVPDSSLRAWWLATVRQKLAKSQQPWLLIRSDGTLVLFVGSMPAWEFFPLRDIATPDSLDGPEDSAPSAEGYRPRPPLGDVRTRLGLLSPVDTPAELRGSARLSELPVKPGDPGWHEALLDLDGAYWLLPLDSCYAAGFEELYPDSLVEFVAAELHVAAEALQRRAPSRLLLDWPGGPLVVIRTAGAPPAPLIDLMWLGRGLQARLEGRPAADLTLNTLDALTLAAVAHRGLPTLFVP